MMLQKIESQNQNKSSIHEFSKKNNEWQHDLTLDWGYAEYNTVVTSTVFAISYIKFSNLYFAENT